MSVLREATLDRVASYMGSYPRRWAFAGGWAIDLFLGRATRAHADIDVATLRADQESLRAHLGNVEAQKVVDGKLVPWEPGEELSLPIHELWVTLPDGARLEILLNEYDASTDEWIFRRDHRVRQPLRRVLRERDDRPYLAPEIVLLYKAKTLDPKNDADFLAALPSLSHEQREWLASALALVHPDHLWIERLKISGAQ